MRRQLFFILPLIAGSIAIKVPVDSEDTQADSTNSTQNTVYYAADDADVDSYLIPPDPHKPDEVEESDIVTPATYLLPPSPDKQTNYYYPPTEPEDQSEWYPIPAQQDIPEVKQKVRTGKVINKARIPLPVPSDHLEPPLVDAQNDYVAPTPSDELELPLEDQTQQFVPEESDYPISNEQPKYSPIFARDGPGFIRINPQELVLSPHLLPPTVTPSKFKNPTKLYPKKFPGVFKPIPIPIAQFAEDGLVQVPRARPLKYYQPIATDELNYLTNAEEKQRYLYEQAELKRKLKEEEDAKFQEQQAPAVETYGEAAPAEQETSASLHGYTGRPVPQRQAPAPAPAPSTQSESAAPPPSDDRTEFRMHGMKGPHSYQFGFDTGKGKNRQFRYEERDNDGSVKGHYGYMDKRGKLRVVNYRAHPEHGFQADAPIEKEQ